MLCARLLVATTILVGACADNECAPVIYSCEPLPEGSPGSIGDPMWHPSEAAKGFECHADVVEVFPAGCTARIAESGASGGYRTFECFGETAFGWGELL